jgi:hypothetical protein
LSIAISVLIASLHCGWPDQRSRRRHIIVCMLLIAALAAIWNALGSSQ